MPGASSPKTRRRSGEGTGDVSGIEGGPAAETPGTVQPCRRPWHEARQEQRLHRAACNAWRLPELSIGVLKQHIRTPTPAAALAAWVVVGLWQPRGRWEGTFTFFHLGANPIPGAERRRHCYCY